MSWEDAYRVVLATVCWLLVIRFVFFMHHYVKVIWPLRQGIKEGVVIAPPPWETLIYHIAVAYIVFIQAAGTVWALRVDRPGSWVGPALIPGEILLFVVVDRFSRAYSKILHEVERDQG